MSRPRAPIVALLAFTLVTIPAVAHAQAIDIVIVAPVRGESVGAIVSIVAETTGSVTSVTFDASVGGDPPVWSSVDTDPSDGWGGELERDRPRRGMRRSGRRGPTAPRP